MEQTETPTLGWSLSIALERLVPLVRSLAPSGVSPTMQAVLARLDRGDLRLSELAHAVAVSQPAMTQLVNRMEKEGLVVRRRSDSDRRGVLVGISDHGREVLTARRARRVEVLDELAAGLDEDDRATLTAAMPALGRLIQLVQPLVQPIERDS